jgi:hypothetical protein
MGHSSAAIFSLQAALPNRNSVVLAGYLRMPQQAASGKSQRAEKLANLST